MYAAILPRAAARIGYGEVNPCRAQHDEEDGDDDRRGEGRRQNCQDVVFGIQGLQACRRRSHAYMGMAVNWNSGTMLRISVRVRAATTLI